MMEESRMQSNPYPDDPYNRPTEKDPGVVPPPPQQQGSWDAPNSPSYPPNRSPYQAPTRPAQDAAQRAVAGQEGAYTFAYGVGKFMDFLQWVLIVLEVILFLRFLFKLIGADPTNPFATFLYNLSGVFVYVFRGIVSDLTFGSHSGNVFETSTLIAMLVYALIFWMLKLLLRTIISRPEEPVA